MVSIQHILVVISKSVQQIFKHQYLPQTHFQEIIEKKVIEEPEAGGSAGKRHV